MSFLYVSNARIPTEKANGVQIMHMCRAFAGAGEQVKLVVPGKRNFLDADPFEYYGVGRNFSISRLPIPDIASMTGRLPKAFFIFDFFMFALSAWFSGVARPGDTIYCRDFPLLLLFSPRRNRLVLEVHQIYGWRRLFLHALRKAALIVAITHGVRQELVSLGVPADKICVAPDGVDLASFENVEPQEEARKRLGLPADKKIALYIGRIDGWKGTDTFFAAAEFLPRDIEAVVIGGEGSELEGLRKKYPRVRFLGYRPYREIAGNQSAADILVLPNSAQADISARYTSPLKLFTYMASGKPIVASDLPSIREVLDENSAYLVPPDDPRALAEGMERALGEPGEASKKALRARDLVKAYSWDARAGSILRAIQDRA